MRAILRFINSHSRHPAAPRKTPVQRRSELTVERILDAAALIFSELGYSATTTNHVAAEAGVSIGSLYQYFPNKDALLVALEERHLHEVALVLRDAAQRWRAQRPGPGEWAIDLVDTLVAANDAPLHVLTYDTAPALPHVDRLTEAVLADLVREAAFHLRRWGHGRRSAARAEVLVAASVRLVHDLAIHRVGNDRGTIRREVVRLVVLAATPDRV